MDMSEPKKKKKRKKAEAEQEADMLATFFSVWIFHIHVGLF